MSDETTPVPSTTTRRRSAAVWWGVALMLVGAALLVSQFVPSVQLWRYWPLIIVAFGIRGIFGPTGKAWSIKYLAEGLSTVAIGLVFLGQMIGYLDWNVWLNILRLWPLLLISLGLEILGKGVRNEWIRALGSVVVIAGLAYGALVMTPTTGWPPSWVPGGAENEPFERSAAHEADVEDGKVTIDGGVGRLTLKAGDDLVTAEGRSPFEPQFEVDSSGGKADLRVGLGSGSWGPLEGDAVLDVTLDRDVVWDLDVSAGVTTYTLDLRDLAVRALRLDAGVSDGTLTLGHSDATGERDPIEVKVDAGVSALKIRVPEGDNVRISVGEGLTGVDVAGDWTSERDGDGRVYESDGFSADGAYWDIEIDAGIGGITVQYY